ncbi:unnamed protein product [Ascophyllum nodosum]
MRRSSGGHGAVGRDTRASATMTRQSRRGTLTSACFLYGLAVAAGFPSPRSLTFVQGAAIAFHLGQAGESFLIGVPRPETKTRMSVASNVSRRNGKDLAKGDGKKWEARRKGWSKRWENFTKPLAGSVHDEVTFRSGQEGRALTIPQAGRYSSKAWLHNLRTLPSSVILHRIKHPVLAQTCWAAVVSLIHAASGGAWSMSIKPHTLLGSALGLLLVFRTNAAYQRFQEGRKLWEQLLNVSRDIARMSHLYENVFGKPLVQRIANLLAVHAVILQEHLQGYRLPQVWEDLVRPEEVPDLLRTTCNRPLKVVNMIASEIKAVPYDSDDWSSRERLAILSMCNKLGGTIGGCEKLVQTPVPLHYVRHTSRFLTIWCLLLPLVIVGEMGMATAPVVCLATWALFGIQEIGLLIEDPFQSSLSLEIMCNTVYSDVMQTIGQDATLPQEPIPMRTSITVVDSAYYDVPLEEKVEPLSARCRHPALDAMNDTVVATLAH